MLNKKKNSDYAQINAMILLFQSDVELEYFFEH